MVSVKLILIGAIAVTFLLIYVYIYFFGRQQTLRLLVFFKETKINYLIMTSVIFLILLIFFYDTPYYDYVTVVFYLYAIIHISVNSKIEYWKELFPSIMGGLVAGLILLLFVTDELAKPNLRLINWVLITVLMILMAYFTAMKRIEEKSRKIPTHS